MTRWLMAARRAEVAEAEPTKRQPREVSSVTSVLSGGREANAAPPVTPTRTAQSVANVARVPPPDAFPHGVSVAGRPRTWTGRVVSLEHWRRLSDWDRHGSHGRTWNGLTQGWGEKGHPHG